MDKLELHWPAAVTAIIWLGGVLAFRMAGSHDFDALGMGLLFFYFLIPLCALAAGLWYGRTMPGGAKWLLVLVFGLLEVLAITAGTGDWDFGYYWSMAAWAAIPAAVGMLAGSLFGRSREKRAKHRA